MQIKNSDTFTKKLSKECLGVALFMENSIKLVSWKKWRICVQPSVTRTLAEKAFHMFSVFCFYHSSCVMERPTFQMTKKESSGLPLKRNSLIKYSDKYSHQSYKETIRYINICFYRKTFINCRDCTGKSPNTKLLIFSSHSLCSF